LKSIKIKRYHISFEKLIKLELNKQLSFSAQGKHVALVSFEDGAVSRQAAN